MRKSIQVLESERKQFTGVFVSFGTSPKIVLINDITDINGNVILSHAWLSFKKNEEVGVLKEGDLVSFNARCKVKYTQHRTDMNNSNKKRYILSHPSKISRLLEKSNE
ncbi:MAG: hypothetical protein QXG00_07870 [Candidatus Woesearchaeota archaeon]